ncbi:peptidoglycan recognition protein family protein [Tautonia sociabilis]|uniref:N-acetylmuramoyl-L-alanine amidase n=1 Tax=Tautonia sociabilis TaxID=2080755 RepID=A0A432MMZ3_9BACT|nr:peptidoglycan recognition family protein [Tautonia sociabilis]RUL88619.1 N-acetylmuramoyl-L-alanine amidase [Tautonia sociabilis]
MDARWNTLRARRLAKMMVVGLLIASAAVAGCKHRRSALRPVFVDPEPVLVDPSPSSATVIPTDPSGSDYGVSSSPSAVPSPGYEDTYGPYVSPPAGPAAEPELELKPLDEPQPLPPLGNGAGSGETKPSNVDQPPLINSPLNTPMSRRESGRTATLTASRSELRARVQAMADDPLDLVQPPKADRPWRFIVLHHSATPTGGYAAIDRQHRERAGLDGCSYHFVIGNGSETPDGTIEVTRRWSDQRPGAHCREPKQSGVNEYGIGICLVGDLDATGPTPKQVEAARVLVAYLQDRYLIPADRVGTHSDFSASPTVCPGDHFPAEQILGRPALASTR